MRNFLRCGTGKEIALSRDEAFEIGLELFVNEILERFSPSLLQEMNTIAMGLVAALTFPRQGRVVTEIIEPAAH